MKTVFTAPFVTRIYPSPETGKEITVNVREVLLSDCPEKYVERQFEAARALGNHLLPTDIRGMRPWRVEEHTNAIEKFGTLPGEHPWMEIWEIGSTNQLAVLDLVRYTGFFTAQTMARFDRFCEIVTPLLQNAEALIKSASAGGASVKVQQISGTDLGKLAETVLDFNKEHFSFERPRSEVLRGFLKSKTLWFGCC